MIELLEKLVSIPRVSREEGAAADFLKAHMASLGLDVHRKGNNLWVESEPESDKPCILLNAHIDTVKPAASYTIDPFKPVLSDGKLYGLGTNDCGASLVALLEAYIRLTEKQQPYRLIYSATAEEEVSGKGGIEMILPEIGHVDLGIIGEPTGMQPAVAEKGLMVLDCTSHGKSGHAAREEGVNAIYEALQSIEWFRSYQFEKISDFVGPVKMSVTMINAGTQHNVVPDTCTFVVDVRNNGLYTNEELLMEIRQHVSCDVQPRSTRLNGSTIALDHPVVARAIGMDLEPFGSPTISNQTLCPFTTLKIGPGLSSRSHTADEFIVPSEIKEGLEIYINLLDGLQL